MNRFKLHSNCIPVKGISRSIICDLQNQTYKLIPNDLYEILTKNILNTIDEIIGIYKEKEIIEEYFQFLLENDFIFFTDQPELYSQINTEFDYPATISNAIFDYSELNSPYLNKFLMQIDMLNCEAIQIRIYKNISFDELTNICNLLNQTSINSADLYIRFSEDYEFNSKYIEQIIRNQPRLRTIYIHSSPFVKIIINNSGFGNIIYTQKKINDDSHCGEIDPIYFTTNIAMYSESLKFNSCLNRKISVDVNGEIKNCPSINKSYGNIISDDIFAIINNESFRKIWSVSKDKINICNDCEFRYICTDCRAHLENPNDEFSKPLKCGYDPKTNIWEDWTKNKLNIL